MTRWTTLAVIALAVWLSVSLPFSVAAQAEPLSAPPAVQLFEREPAPFIDNNTAFYWCGFGASLGALLVGVPPLVAWSPYIGWPLGLAGTAMRTAFGCYFGILGGTVTSAAISSVRGVGHAVQSLF
ncbi:MAG: hypothetical protein GC191_10270 [Azospirillum sp.]|nr:hypothetical protein [Azospirillum sp.]